MWIVILLIVVGTALLATATLPDWMHDHYRDKLKVEEWKEQKSQLKRNLRHHKCTHCGMNKELH